MTQITSTHLTDANNERAVERYFLVIMPGDIDPHRLKKEAAIRRVALKHGQVPVFPSYGARDSDFDLRSSLQEVRRAEFAIADLSYERPSCYYELGLIEALEKPVFLFAQGETKIHQTASRLRVKRFRDIVDFEDQLLAVLASYSDLLEARQ